MEDKRKKILEINRRTDISNQEKNKLINQIMQQKSSNNVTKNSDTSEIKCTHYSSNCLLECPICNNFYSCRLCHDANEDHVLDRYSISNIKCKLCNTIQTSSNICINCNIEFAKYYCNICNIFDSTPNKNIYHCEKCNICRIGTKDTLKHCDICDMCWDISAFNNHNCVPKNRYYEECVICKEELKNSVNKVMAMNCKHLAHLICINKNLENGNYQCPICRKSVVDMTNYWNTIESYVNNCEMPEEDKNKKVQILCNDCEDKSITNYHYLYHKCQICNSWNTDVLSFIE